MNKTPTNTAALNNLKSQGWEVDVTHWRHLNKGFYIEAALIKDKDFRDGLEGFSRKHYYWNTEVSHFGGATVLELIRGEEKITVRADCYIKDRFNRKLGVRAALDKLQKLYNIS